MNNEETQITKLSVPWRQDASGSLIDIADRVLDLVGYTKAEVLAKQPKFSYPGQQRKFNEVLKMEQRRVTTACPEPYIFILAARHKNGHTVLIQNMAWFLRDGDGQVTEVIGCATLLCPYHYRISVAWPGLLETSREAVTSCTETLDERRRVTPQRVA